MRGNISNEITNCIAILLKSLLFRNYAVYRRTMPNFLSALQDFARADIESIEKKEIHEDFPLPHLFSRVATDEYYEFSRKFDIGLDYLDGIKTDTGEIKVTLGDMKGSLNSIDNTLGTFVVEQKEHNKRMDEHNHWMKEHSLGMKEHNQRLEKILEKLAER